MKINLDQIKPAVLKWATDSLMPNMTPAYAGMLGFSIGIGKADQMIDGFVNFISSTADANGNIELEKLRQGLAYGLKAAGGKYSVKQLDWDFDEADIESFMNVAKEFAK